MVLTPIRFERLRRGMLQWQLAKQAGIPESVMSRIETGRITATPEQLRKIALALDVELERLSADLYEAQNE